MRRFLAVLAALAMVGGSLYLRYGGDDGDGALGGNGGGNQGGDDDRVTLVCDPVFRAACTDLDADVTIEDAAVTAAGLVDDDARPPDAWLTPGPWPEMVVALNPTVALAEATSIGRTRLGVVARNDLGGCGWRCLGLRVVDDRLQLGWRSPGDASALLAIGGLAGGFLEKTDYVTNDFDSRFDGYLSRLVREARRSDDPALEAIQTNGASFDAAVALEVGTEELIERRSSPLTLLYPEPVVVVEAVLAGGGGDLGDELEQSLADLGWDEPSNAPTNLPNAGVLAALWEQVR